MVKPKHYIQIGLETKQLNSAQLKRYVYPSIPLVQLLQ